jgi:hypothetical protein
VIFHVSIEAEEPERVAKAIAELWQGSAQPLDPLVQGSWIAFCGDNALHAVEVFPQGTDITEAGYEGWVGPLRSGLRPTASHVALGTKLTKEAVTAVAEREGWHSKQIRRGDYFSVIEVWVNKYLVIEWLTPQMSKEYDDTVRAMVNA